MDGLDGWMDGWIDWMDGWMDRWIDGWMDGWMDGWIDWMDGLDGWMITNKNTDISPSISTNGSSKPKYGLTGSRATK